MLSRGLVATSGCTLAIIHSATEGTGKPTKIRGYDFIWVLASLHSGALAKFGTS